MQKKYTGNFVEKKKVIYLLCVMQMIALQTRKYDNQLYSEQISIPIHIYVV